MTKKPVEVNRNYTNKKLKKQQPFDPKLKAYALSKIGYEFIVNNGIEVISKAVITNVFEEKPDILDDSPSPNLYWNIVYPNGEQCTLPVFKSATLRRLSVEELLTHQCKEVRALARHSSKSRTKKK